MDDFGHLEPLEGVFPEDVSIPLPSFHKAIIDPISNNRFPFVAAQHPSVKDPPPPLFTEQNAMLLYIPQCLQFADNFLAGTLPNVDGEEHPFRHTSRVIAIQFKLSRDGIASIRL